MRYNGAKVKVRSLPDDPVVSKDGDNEKISDDVKILVEPLQDQTLVKLMADLAISKKELERSNIKAAAHLVVGLLTGFFGFVAGATGFVVQDRYLCGSGLLMVLLGLFSILELKKDFAKTDFYLQDFDQKQNHYRLLTRGTNHQLREKPQPSLSVSGRKERTDAETTTNNRPDWGLNLL